MIFYFTLKLSVDLYTCSIWYIKTLQIFLGQLGMIKGGNKASLILAKIPLKVNSKKDKKKLKMQNNAYYSLSGVIIFI